MSGVRLQRRLYPADAAFSVEASQNWHLGSGRCEVIRSHFPLSFSLTFFPQG